MKPFVKINLRDIYPNQYQADNYILVSQPVANFIIQCDKRMLADKRQRERYQAQAHLDRDSFLLKNGCVYESLEEAVEKELDQQELYLAINKLPEVQSKRVYAHYFLGISVRRIALNEGVDESAIRHSLERALMNLKKYLKKL